MVYPRKSNDSTGTQQTCVLVSFTVNFSRSIIVRMACSADLAVLRQQITKSSA